MDRIWAPWRVEYVTSGYKERDRCFLCIDSSDDESSLVVHRSQKAFVIMNRFPYNNGHVMVAPIRHVASLEDLEEEEILQIFGLLRILSKIFKEDFRVDGINVGLNLGRASGAGLEDHLHVHVVPRWFGDTNFMPVISETKIISEHLLSTYQKLRKRFKEILSL